MLKLSTVTEVRRIPPTMGTRDAQIRQSKYFLHTSHCNKTAQTYPPHQIEYPLTFQLRLNPTFSNLYLKCQRLATRSHLITRTSANPCTHLIKHNKRLPLYSSSLIPKGLISPLTRFTWNFSAPRKNLFEASCIPPSHALFAYYPRLCIP